MVGRVARTVTDSILDSWAVRGVCLGDATREVLQAQAAQDAENSAEFAKTAQFYDMLAKRLNNDEQTVRGVLSEAQVRRIAAKVWGGDGPIRKSA